MAKNQLAQNSQKSIAKSLVQSKTKTHSKGKSGSKSGTKAHRRHMQAAQAKEEAAAVVPVVAAEAVPCVLASTNTVACVADAE